MNPLTRWLKFNLVGMAGMAIQLTTLALLNHLFPGHYLCATAAAIELTLLHNFLWHRRYTWRDRPDPTAWPRQLLQFHLSNGLVSMLGNLMLMHLFVRATHVPLLLSNALSILICSFINFGLSDRWTFAAQHDPGRLRVSPAADHAMNSSLTLVASVLLALGAIPSRAQQLPQAPMPVPSRGGLGTDCAYENVFAGPVASLSGSAMQPSFTAGVTIGQYFARTLGDGVVASPQFELGIVGPLPGGYPLDGLVSIDAMLANKLPHRELYPFFNFGYTRIFATGNAVNFAFGIDLGKEKDDRLIRIELRDYYLFTGPQQHVVGLRIGFGKLIAD